MILYEELGQHTAAYAEYVTKSIRAQLRVQQIEAEVAAYYRRLEVESAERRANNPEAYQFPPGYQRHTPAWEPHCPECGQPLP